MLSTVFLVLFPFLAAVILSLMPNGKARNFAGYAAGIAIILATIYLATTFFGGTPLELDAKPEFADTAILLLEALMALYIVYVSFRRKNYYVLGLAAIQAALLFYFEWTMHGRIENESPLFFDTLSIVMALVIGIIGSLICIYSFGYMRDFHEHHKEVRDRRNQFFLVMFAFLGAMFGLVFSNDLLWLYFFWEVTTLCSFILIGYTGTEEAARNAFNALFMNLLGGLAFILAVIYLGTLPEPVFGLNGLLATGKALVLLPAALIGFAGLTKSAQLPFSSWLVGAMVAPTPVSALLHSSTMVKAGVYVILRLAPIFQGTAAGAVLSLIGGATFLISSALAVSQSNAKKVLAYSTIANLGLVVACGGVGTYEALWAGILLIIFHALAKSLMFLSVGTTEHRIGSREIDDMEGLIDRSPGLGAMMLVGISGMFLAPFGMLLSKWATLRAFIEADPILFAMVAFGSGLTVFFWGKWMGRIVASGRQHRQIDEKTSLSEWSSLLAITGLMVGACLLFPVISAVLVEPYVSGIYGKSAQLGQDNTLIMFLMFAVVVFMPLTILYFRRQKKTLPPYMGSRPSTPEMRFRGTAGVEKELALKNYYMEELFGEGRILGPGAIACAALIVVMFAVSLVRL